MRSRLSSSGKEFLANFIALAALLRPDRWFLIDKSRLSNCFLLPTHPGCGAWNCLSASSCAFFRIQSKIISSTLIGFNPCELVWLFVSIMRSSVAQESVPQAETSFSCSLFHYFFFLRFFLYLHRAFLSFMMVNFECQSVRAVPDHQAFWLLFLYWKPTWYSYCSRSTFHF